jgi:hypothetical protein
MKRIKRTVAALTLACAFLFGIGSVAHVRADTSGPQGQQDSKSKGPSTGSSSQTDYYLLWLIILWLLGLL